ncbi:TMV resistance protein N-like [Vigna unguiculata]|uniref:TMV resistance protein N-like n=1 Tax=Vigna unguiculata TaxID=3917 RepID=UPI001016E800|nr:TMV resistance protein N-like [Vigna unguiculata]
MEFASSTSKLPHMYDVLINFNGEDIHRKFVSHLDSVLSAAGLTTFLHHQNAVNDMDIQQPILNLCRVAIVVFTKTYSQSAWCLHQLQQIIEWHKTYYRHVLPVYYEIQPSDVRLQTEDFGKDLKATAQQTFSAQQLEHGRSMWSHALSKTAEFFGWDESNYRSDAELVDTIVKSILNLPVLSATKFPIGLQPHVEDVIQIIKNKSNGVCTVGICGIGGSGKTTLAKAIYNQIHAKFLEKSFIEDISEVSRTRMHAHLQQRLLSDLLKTKVEIRRVEMGRNMIRERLYGKKVLIVLDDVNEYGPLDLWESSARFGEGTVIIITSRDESLLRTHQVDSIFRMNLMNPNKSLELLSWHAFRDAKPKEECHFLAKMVVDYCGGLPLALEVIGSFLYERTKEEWNKVLSRLECLPQHEVIEILKISFDGLPNEIERNLFLDICCFFVGNDRVYVTKILNDCGVDPDRGIRVLIKRNLIKVRKNNKFGMHPLLRQMARQIISEILSKEPGKISGLWLDEDMEHALSWYTLFSSQQTKVIERLPSGRDFFERYPYPSEVREPSRTPVNLAGVSWSLYEKVRWVSLKGFSSEYLPNDFYLHDAIVIDLKHNLLRLVWKEPQVLARLKVLNLSHSIYLTETPDFSRLPALQQLILKNCQRLREVHRSIGFLYNLTLLNLKGCTGLSNLPREIYMLKSLKALVLSGCSKIVLLEKDIVQMESLITLISENTVVKQVPFSIASSKSIGYISLCGLEEVSHNLFPFIIRSQMSPTMNPLSYIHTFSDMEDNSWDDIVPFFNSLAILRSVLVQCDPEFQLSKQLKAILVDYCVNITESRISKHHLRSCLVGVGRYEEFFNSVNDGISEVLASSGSCDVCLPGDNYPYWSAHRGEGHSASFTVPRDCVMKGMILCVVCLSTPEIIEPELTTVLIGNYTRCTLQIHNHGTVISFNDEDWHHIISNLGSGDRVEIFVSSAYGLVVKETAVYLMHGEPKKNSLIRSIKKIIM